MPQPPTTERLTAGEKRLADVIDFQAAPNSSDMTRCRVDLVWDADSTDTATRS